MKKQHWIIGSALLVILAGGVGISLTRSPRPAAAAKVITPTPVNPLRSVSPPKSLDPGHLVTPEADAAYRAAYDEYQKGNYAAATVGFYKASSADPSAPGPHFFLGVCYLMTNDNRAAIRELKMVVGLDESPYVAPARFYLAKGYVRQGDEQNARRELDEVVKTNDRMRAEAESLIAALAVK